MRMLMEHFPTRPTDLKAEAGRTGTTRNTVLVIDDEPLFRDLVAEVLEGAGYRVLRAADGAHAVSVLGSERPDLILLDLAMPGMDGFQFLRAVREREGTRTIPVILVSGRSDKAAVLEAARLGAQGYILKSGFSLKTLLAKVNQHVPTTMQVKSPVACTVTERGAPLASACADDHTNPRMICQTEERREFDSGENVEIVPLLTREAAVERAETVMRGRTLSGVVAQVMSMAASNRGDMAELASLIARDALLSARVLQAANSAAYASKKGVVTTIPEAVRHIGCGTVRNIAAALEVIDSIPRSDDSGFNPVRHWQHSFAVAVLCERIAAPAEAGLAHLVGLCHDLPEILFRTRFANEYALVLHAHADTGRDLEELERIMLGASRQELQLNILATLGLPDAIRCPIEEFHAAAESPGPGASRLARVLRIADLYANGVLLGYSAEAPVCCLSEVEFRTATGMQQPPVFDSDRLRGEVYGLTAMLARLSAADERELMTPLVPRSKVRLWIARDRSISELDPVTSALGSIADVDVRPGLPSAAEEWSGHDALVVLARNTLAPGFTSVEVDKARRLAGGSLPVLWLCGKVEFALSRGQAVTPEPWPVRLNRLARFVRGAAEVSTV